MRVALLWLSVGCALGGCRVFDESLLSEDAGRPEAGRDAGPDAPFDGGFDGGMDAGPACPLRKPPPRPMVLDAPSMDEVWFALEGLDLDPPEGAWATLGYDLDGLCSILPDPEVECLPPDTGSPPEIDGEGGIDNALLHQIVPLLLVARPELADETALYQHQGVSAIILRIRRWNGSRDDPFVDAMVAASDFGTPALPDGGIPTPAILADPDAGYPELPAWDGNDYWWLRGDNFSGEDVERPRIRDANAYIAGGTLVMRLPDNVPLIFSGGVRTVTFALTDAVLTAEISEDLSRIERTVIAGRWPTTVMLEGIEASGICPGTRDYDRFAQVLDLAADIRADPGTGGPGATCDAVSLGLTFFGTRANFGGIANTRGTPNACENMMMDGGVDAGSGDAGTDGGTDAGPGDAGMDGGRDGGPADAGTDAGGADAGL